MEIELPVVIERRRTTRPVATTFYGQLVEGCSLGKAIQTSRGAVRKSGSIDWAEYVHYGTQDFALKVHPG